MSDTTPGSTSGPLADRGWRDRAACRGVDPELFFPTAESGPTYDEQVAAAKWVCARCPVREHCLGEALARIPYGIAGGLTEHERRELPRDQRTRTVRRYGDGQEIRSVGLCDGWTRAQRADLGRTLLAGGRPIELVARTCGVSTRTVERWATAHTAREGSHGGNRAPLGSPTPINPLAGISAAEGHESR